MNAKKLLISITILVILGLSNFLVGCGSKEIQIKTSQEPKTRLELSQPTPISIKPIKWYIITPENQKEIFEKLQKEKTSQVLFGLTDQGYENLSLNTAQLKKFILEQNSIIEMYKQYYESDKTESKVQETED